MQTNTWAEELHKAKYEKDFFIRLCNLAYPTALCLSKKYPFTIGFFYEKLLASLYDNSSKYYEVVHNSITKKRKDHTIDVAHIMTCIKVMVDADRNMSKKKKISCIRDCNAITDLSYTMTGQPLQCIPVFKIKDRHIEFNTPTELDALQKQFVTQINNIDTKRPKVKDEYVQQLTGDIIKQPLGSHIFTHDVITFYYRKYLKAKRS